MLLAFSCQKENTELDIAEIQELDIKDLELTPEEDAKYQMGLAEMGQIQTAVSTRATFDYVGGICNAAPTPGIYGGGGGSDSNISCDWDFYCFNGTAGDVVTIQVDRSSDAMDPASVLYFGTTLDCEGLFWRGSFSQTNPDLVWIDKGDDEVSHPSCFADPLIEAITLPSTGTYTFAVLNFLDCDGDVGPYPYVITTNGISDCSAACGDSDGDGVNDDVDNCPNTANPDQANNDGDTEGDVCDDDDDDNDGVDDINDNCQFVANADQANYEGDGMGDVCDPDDDNDGIDDVDDDHPMSSLETTVIIDGCDSGVSNMQVSNGSNMSDLIADCAAAASNHGDFVSCVAALTNDWKSAGLISGKQKGAIQSCAGQANLP